MTEPTKPTEPEDKAKALARVETSVCGLVLHTLEDMKTVAQLILQSGLAPDSFKTAEQIFVGLQTGAEVGLKPMQALNSIVVIKGKPTLWGDAALALVKRSGLLRKYTEKVTGEGDDMIAYVTSVRDDEQHEFFVETTFSVADAKTAKLWGKAGPWTTHPKRMLKYKARAFNLRDNFPDVLFGMHLTEEMYGEEPLPAPESDVPPRAERRSMAVPSSTVDTTRAPVQEAEGPAPVAEEKPEPESKLVTFQCPKCLRTYEYGKEEGKGVKCECGKSVITEQLSEVPKDGSKGYPKGLYVIDEQEKPVERSIEEKGDAAALYVEVNSMFIAQDGKGFVEFAAYVLCLDDSEVAPSKLTEEQLKQIKAYIETSGVAIN